MITKARAMKLVSNEVCVVNIDLPDDDEIIILDDATIEKPWGWIFFYTSRKFHETSDLRYAVAGNAPIIVERESGRLIVTGTAHTIQHYIENYEQTGSPHTLREDSSPPKEPETIWRLFDSSAIPVSVSSQDDESTVIPFGWILLWIIVIALVALLVWIIF